MSHNGLVDAAHISEIQRRILGIQIFTILWMTIEVGVALTSAWKSRSPALLGFGGDSLIELLSAAIVYWRFRDERVAEVTERRTARIAGSLLFALAAFVIVNSGTALLGRNEVRTSLAGIALLLVAAFIMPWLARAKRHLASRTGSGALRADAAESALCGYMAWIALAGLVINAAWKVQWADPVAAILLVPIILREGWEAVQGKACRDCA